MDVQELIVDIFEEINASTVTDDEDLLMYANELAAGVDAERDAAIAEALPVPYTMQKPARAQLDGDFIRMPRVVYVDASKVGDRDWAFSKFGRRLNREKMDCAVGMNVEFEMPANPETGTDAITIMRFAILWRRNRE